MNFNFNLKILWLKKSVGIAIDEVHLDNFNVPLTNYYFWPKNTTWELLNIDLNSKLWVPNSQKAVILNHITDILELWASVRREHGFSDKLEFCMPLFEKLNRQNVKYTSLKCFGGSWKFQGTLRDGNGFTIISRNDRLEE